MPPDPSHAWSPPTDACAQCGCMRLVAIALKPCRAVVAADAEVEPVDWFGLNRSAG